MTTEPPQQPSIAEKIAQGLEEFADALESGEDVTQRFNCHKVVLELVPTPYTPELVRETRRELNASQAVFARFLGVSVNTVRSINRWLSSQGYIRAPSLYLPPHLWRICLDEPALTPHDRPVS